MKKMNIVYVGTLTLLSGLLLSGCASEPQFKPSDFTAVPKIQKETKVINAADAVSDASFKYKPDPAVMKAYKTFITKGKMDVVNTKGFIAYPFSADFQPVIPAQPLQALDVQLEPGERIQPSGIVLGDTQRWTYTILMSYSNGIPVQHLIFKPKDWNIATNIIVGTNKRTYHFGVVSTKEANVKQVKFWYPEEMQRRAMAYINSQSKNTGSTGNTGSSSSGVIADVPNINI
jgi:hypothetical protein